MPPARAGRWTGCGNATHASDEDAPARNVLGHAIRDDAQATEASRREIVDFFGRYLRDRTPPDNRAPDR
jgi:hypothetical protein